MQASVKQWTRPPRAALIAAAVLAIGVLIAACGGGSGSPGVASVGSSTSSAGTAKSASGAKGKGLLALSRCMRSHGVPNFPDASSGGNITISSADGVDPNSPAFKTAMTACRSLAPGGHPSPALQAKAMAQALAFSRCMRSHGVAKFPDPTGQGKLELKAGPGTGIDPSSPQFQSAQHVCQHLMGAPNGAPGSGPSVAHGSGSGEVLSIGGSR